MAPDYRPHFPTYLLPSLPFHFRGRQSSTTSTASTISEPVPSLSSSPTSSPSTSPGSSPPSGYYIQQRGPVPISKEQDAGPTLHRSAPNTLKCITCSADIAFASQIVSKGFTGRQGRAYLVAPPPSSLRPLGTSAKHKRDRTELINTRIGRAVNRDLLTGAHVVADVSCSICSTILGWKYVDAKEAAQRYKIGKFILEMKRVVPEVRWDDEGLEESSGEGLQIEYVVEDIEDDTIVFDSDDEDECEDLFAGQWDAATVAKRRSRRITIRKKTLEV
ncbi:uncharacterized protein BP5553_05043 [Venustampulla echinocandica]|uniref:Yippee domain-containing protein n=1 Tax=Venustampulla echinocandica TaxID=2656787 RepID=A0A370TQ21_9HELO|nr:uncharacterized protein BP5553_05043 [Venustampulla echinocandica]RDL37610.1 hypothetical protein BP5553_05043 [Venustampulla echinocandica]